MNRLDHRGHGPIATWGDDEASRSAAADIFRRERTPLKDGGGGCVMYRVAAAAEATTFIDESGIKSQIPKGAALGEKLDVFDPEAVEILAVPQLAAG